MVFDSPLTRTLFLDHRLILLFGHTTLEVIIIFRYEFRVMMGVVTAFITLA